jgi:hypothetical protein
MGSREFGETQVLRLDTETFRFERLNPSGTAPGWISSHRAALASSNEIRVTGGVVAVPDGDTENLLPNGQAYVLDVANLKWRCE